MTEVSLRMPGFQGPLALARVPKFLRFVRSFGGAWDALDQLEDSPRRNEHVVAAVLVGRSNMFLDGRHKCGRRWGRVIHQAEYQPVPIQPPADVLLENAKWQAWCLSQKSNTEEE